MIYSVSVVGFMEVRTVTNKHRIEDVLKVIEQHSNEPILFKKFITNPTEKWNRIENYHRDYPLKGSDDQLNYYLHLLD